MYVSGKPSPRPQGQGNGYSLMEVLVSLAVTSVLFLGVTASVSQFTKQQKALSDRMTSMAVNVNLRRTLANDSALMNTLFNASNSAFDCLRDATLDPIEQDPNFEINCANKEGTLNQLISASGQVLIDLSDPTAGFTAAGEPCTGYGTNPECTVKVRIDVKYVCDGVPAGTCTKPQIVLTGTLEIAGDDPKHPTIIANAFEVRKDWSTMTTNLVELTETVETTGGGVMVKDFKLVIIVDNSTSMSAYQQKLSDSLAPMLDSLRSNDFNLAVQIFSTTQFMMVAPNSYNFPRPVNSSHQNLQLASVSCSDGVTSRSNYCTSYPQMAGIQKEIYNLKAPVQVILPARATETDFSNFKSTILTTIKNMGVSGSDNEQALCSLSRLLTAGNNFLATGDKLGVIFISNEEDNSTTQTCASQIDRKYKPLGPTEYAAQPRCTMDPIVPAASFTDHIDYHVKVRAGAAGYRIDFRCNAYRDGEFVPYNPADSSTYKGDKLTPNYVVMEAFPQQAGIKQYGVDIEKTCQQSGINFTGTKTDESFGSTSTMQTGSCTAEMLTALQNNGNCGHRFNGVFIPGKVATCTVSCADSMNWAPIRVEVPSNPTARYPRQIEELDKNYCATPFELGDFVSQLLSDKYPDNYQKMSSGPTYNQISSLIPISPVSKYQLWTPPAGESNCCRVQQYHKPFPAPDAEHVYKSVFEPYEGLTNVPIQDALVSRANTMFGEDGYFISSIIHTSDPAQVCPKTGTETTGLAFESLSRKVQKSAMVPICAADYTPALAPLRQFITESVTTIIGGNDLIKIKQGEQIVQLYVSNGVEKFQFQVGGSSGVWPTLVAVSADGMEKTYRLDFSKTGYQLASTDRIWGLVAKQSSTITIGSIGEEELSYDSLRSRYNIGVGH